MKRFIFAAFIIAIIFIFSSCSQVQTLTEDEAKAVIEAVSTASSGSIANPDSNKTAEDLAKALSSNFSKTQTGGGKVTFSITAERNGDLDDEDGLSGAFYFDVVFTDFEVGVTDDNGNTTTYTLNGTMYMEYKLYAGYDSNSFSFGYQVLCFTDSSDTLSIVGGTLNTQLELNVSSTIAMAISSDVYSLSCVYSGSCNGNTFTDVNVSLSATL